MLFTSSILWVFLNVCRKICDICPHGIWSYMIHSSKIHISKTIFLKSTPSIIKYMLLKVTSEIPFFFVMCVVYLLILQWNFFESFSFSEVFAKYSLKQEEERAYVNKKKIAVVEYLLNWQRQCRDLFHLIYAHIDLRPVRGWASFFFSLILSRRFDDTVFFSCHTHTLHKLNQIAIPIE